MPHGDRLNDIKVCLDALDLERLFGDVLLWGRTAPAPRDIGLGDGQRVRLQPLAELGGVPVFRADWPGAKPPTVAERRKVQRKLMETYSEHLLVYITQRERERERERERTTVR